MIKNEKPIDRFHDFVDFLNAGDLTGLVELYSSGALHVREDGSLAVGRDEIKTVMDQFIGMQPNFQSEIVRTVEIEPDLVMVIDRWHMVAKGPDGAEIQMEGSGMHLLHCKEGRWEFAATGLSNFGIDR
ncbi:MAG: nuclear transport factor 2 family protein [Balneolaceae bacterium]|nr:nuclear transport factor 2 family protein [Balneolaceae bacterium]